MLHYAMYSNYLNVAVASKKAVLSAIIVPSCMFSTFHKKNFSFYRLNVLKLKLICGMGIKRNIQNKKQLKTIVIELVTLYM